MSLVEEQTRHRAAKLVLDSHHERWGGTHSKTGLGRGRFRGLIQDRLVFVPSQMRLIEGRRDFTEDIVCLTWSVGDGTRTGRDSKNKRA